MKSLYVLMLITLFSCQKQNEKRQNLSNELNKNVQAVLSQPSLNAVSNAAKLLTTQEKQSLWEAKLSTIYVNDAKIFTPQQLQIFNQIKSMLNEYGIAGLSKNQTIGKAFLDKNLPFFEQHFSKMQFYYLIEHPYFNKNFSIAKMNRAPSILARDGEVDDDLDPSPTTTKCTCLYDLGCETSKKCSKKTTDECERQAKCGLFGTSNCTGLCE